MYVPEKAGTECEQVGGDSTVKGMESRQMRILMFGRGVIATQYGWAFEKDGHDVDFYVRPGRAADFGSTVDLEIEDGRAGYLGLRGRRVEDRWPITMREDLTADHDYDLIVLSVNSNQLAGALEFLAPRLGEATLLVFNNVWDDPAEVVADLPAERIVWGFPGAGGGYFGTTLRGGLLRTVFLGLVDRDAPSARHRQVHDQFAHAGFTVVEIADFRSWLWFHYILDAGLTVGMRMAGGFAAFRRSPGAGAIAARLMREMVDVLVAKGGTPGPGATAVRRLPPGVVGLGLRTLLSEATIFGAVSAHTFASGHGSYEMTSAYARDVLADAHRLGVPVPQLEALEPVFK